MSGCQRIFLKIRDRKRGQVTLSLYTRMRVLSPFSPYSIGDSKREMDSLKRIYIGRLR